MQYLNAADREACCKGDLTRIATFQRYLEDLPNHGFGEFDEEMARNWLSSAIKKLSPAPATF